MFQYFAAPYSVLQTVILVYRGFVLQIEFKLGYGVSQTRHAAQNLNLYFQALTFVWHNQLDWRNTSEII